MADLSWLPEPAWTPTMAEYHGPNGLWGSSMLKTFRDSPGLAWHYYVKQDLELPPPSAAMILGSLVHMLLLEPETYDDEVEVVQVKGKTAKAYKASVLSNPQKLVVTATEDEAAHCMADSVLRPQTESARIAAALLSPDRPSAAEYSYRWDDESGVSCRVRFDYLTETKQGPVMPNIKTTADPTTEGFMKRAFNFGYHASQAFYERGFRHMTGGLTPTPLLIVIHNEPPYEVCLKQPTEEWMELGRRQIKEDLSRLSDALKMPERWAWAAEWESGIETLELPPWARLKHQDAFTDTF